MKGHRTLHLLCLALLFYALSSTAFAQATVKRQFEVVEDGRALATVVTEVSNEAQKVYVYRQNQSPHIFGSFPSVSAGSIYIGRAKVLSFYANMNRVETVADSFVASAQGRRGRKDVKAIHQQVIDDMRILRAVRAFEPSVELQELLFVIATGDDTILRAEAPTSLQVIEQSQTAQSRSSAQRTSLSSRVIKAIQSGTPPNSLEGCTKDCSDNREKCVNDRGVDDKTPCYTGYYACQQNCYNIYGPKQPTTPAPRPS